jgi:hypothetical protein
MPLSRRRLLQFLGTLSVVAGIPLATRLWRQDRPSAPAAAVPARSGPFPYLNVDPAAFDAFESDHRRHAGRRLERNQWSDEVQTQFLLSTDFFRFDADETRLISYVGYYDPSVTPCNNPLARFD